jgi:hypothetical protein
MRVTDGVAFARPRRAIRCPARLRLTVSLRLVPSTPRGASRRLAASRVSRCLASRGALRRLVPPAPRAFDASRLRRLAPPTPRASDASRLRRLAASRGSDASRRLAPPTPRCLPWLRRLAAPSASDASRLRRLAPRTPRASDASRLRRLAPPTPRASDASRLRRLAAPTALASFLRAARPSRGLLPRVGARGVQSDGRAAGRTLSRTAAIKGGRSWGRDRGGAASGRGRPPRLPGRATCARGATIVTEVR